VPFRHGPSPGGVDRPAQFGEAVRTLQEPDQDEDAPPGHGVLVRAAGEGRIASPTRADYAAGAVAVLTGEGHENTMYELSGDHAWSFAEFAAELGRQTGKEIVYRPVTVEAYVDLLVGAGMPELYAGIMADADASFGKANWHSRVGSCASTSPDPQSVVGVWSGFAQGRSLMSRGVGAEETRGRAVRPPVRPPPLWRASL
jgi:hypothetical protein